MPTAPKRRAALPLAALSLLAVGLGGATFLAQNAAPEIVAADGAAPAIDGRALAQLEQAAERDPSEANLLALGDGYWQAQNGEEARTLYERVVREISPVPAVAFERLGMLYLQTDVARALENLELARNADPDNLEVLYFLGEIYYANEDMADAADAWRSYLEAPGGAGDTEVEARLARAEALEPLLAAAQEAPSEANLLAVGENYWTNEERGKAVDVYFQLLTEANPHNATALSRVGQQLFFGGRNQEAITVLSRARQVAPDDLPTLLFLGNAHFTLGQYRKAIAVWQQYVRAAGGPDSAGRVPALIADAQERLRTGALPPSSEDTTEAARNSAPATP